MIAAMVVGVLSLIGLQDANAGASGVRQATPGTSLEAYLAAVLQAKAKDVSFGSVPVDEFDYFVDSKVNNQRCVAFFTDGTLIAVAGVGLDEKASPPELFRTLILSGQQSPSHDAQRMAKVRWGEAVEIKDPADGPSLKVRCGFMPSTGKTLPVVLLAPTEEGDCRLQVAQADPFATFDVRCWDPERPESVPLKPAGVLSGLATRQPFVQLPGRSVMQRIPITTLRFSRERPVLIRVLPFGKDADPDRYKLSGAQADLRVSFAYVMRGSKFGEFQGGIKVDVEGLKLPNR